MANQMDAKCSSASVIACEAETCVYNHAHKCDAGHINVTGSHACASKDTACGTFKEK